MTEEENKEISPKATCIPACQMGVMEGQKMWCPWLEGGTIYCSTGRHRKISPTGQSLVQTPEAHAQVRPWGGPIPCTLAPPCLHWCMFMPPIISAFACQDIQEIPREKNGHICPSFAVPRRAKQPAKKGPTMPFDGEHSWTKEGVGFYLSFMDEKVFRRVDLPKEEKNQPSAPTATATDTPGITATVETLPTWRATLAYTRWDTILHSSRPVIAAGEVPWPTTVLQAKRRVLQPTGTILFSPPPETLKASSPPRSPPLARALALLRPPTPPHGFTGVAACLRTPELVEVDQNMPVSMMAMGMISNPGMLSISSSQVVKDNGMGLVYLDTVTMSIGRMVIGSTESKEGPTIEDVTDQL